MFLAYFANAVFVINCIYYKLTIGEIIIRNLPWLYRYFMIHAWVLNFAKILISIYGGLFVGVCGVHLSASHSVTRTYQPRLWVDVRMFSRALKFIKSSSASAKNFIFLCTVNTALDWASLQLFSVCNITVSFNLSTQVDVS